MNIICPSDGSVFLGFVGLVSFDVVSIEVITVGITVHDEVNTEVVSDFVVENVATFVPDESARVVPISIVV